MEIRFQVIYQIATEASLMRVFLSLLHRPIIKIFLIFQFLYVPFIGLQTQASNQKMKKYDGN